MGKGRAARYRCRFGEWSTSTDTTNVVLRTGVEMSLRHPTRPNHAGKECIVPFPRAVRALQRPLHPVALGTQQAHRSWWPVPSACPDQCVAGVRAPTFCLSRQSCVLLALRIVGLIGWSGFCRLQGGLDVRMLGCLASSLILGPASRWSLR